MEDICSMVQTAHSTAGSKHTGVADATKAQSTLKSVAADLGAAAAASCLISPIVSAIDSTIVRRAATGKTLRYCLWLSAVEMARRPFSIVHSKPLRLAFGVYFGTYASANLVDSIHSRNNSLPAATQSSTTTKFVTTTAVSTGLCIYKDANLARILSSKTKSLPVPAPSYGLFLLRDAVTIYASFSLPVVVAPVLASFASTTTLGQHALALMSDDKGLKTSQILLPAMVQLISSPIHLLGLDYNMNRAKVSLLRRLMDIKRGIGAVIPLRMMRIVPAFGVGNVVNTSAREAMLGWEK